MEGDANREVLGETIYNLLKTTNSNLKVVASQIGCSSVYARVLLSDFLSSQGIEFGKNVRYYNIDPSLPNPLLGEPSSRIYEFISDGLNMQEVSQIYSIDVATVKALLYKQIAVVHSEEEIYTPAGEVKQYWEIIPSAMNPLMKKVDFENIDTSHLSPKAKNFIDNYIGANFLEIIEITDSIYPLKDMSVEVSALHTWVYIMLKNGCSIEDICIITNRGESTVRRYMRDMKVYFAQNTHANRLKTLGITKQTLLSPTYISSWVEMRKPLDEIDQLIFGILEEHEGEISLREVSRIIGSLQIRDPKSDKFYSISNKSVATRVEKLMKNAGLSPDSPLTYLFKPHNALSIRERIIYWYIYNREGYATITRMANDLKIHTDTLQKDLFSIIDKLGIKVDLNNPLDVRTWTGLEDADVNLITPPMRS